MPRRSRRFNGERRQKNLALKFLAQFAGDKLTDQGLFLSLADDIDPWGQEHDFLPLAGVKRGDAKFRQHQADRENLRKRINTGACCTTLPNGCRFKIRPIDGDIWRVILFGKAAREDFQAIAFVEARRIADKIKRVKNALEIAALDATATELLWLRDAIFETSLMEADTLQYGSRLAARIAHTQPPDCAAIEDETTAGRRKDSAQPKTVSGTVHGNA